MRLLTGSERIVVKLNLKVLFNPCVLFVFVENEGTEVGQRSDWSGFDVKTQATLEDLRWMITIMFKTRVAFQRLVARTLELWTFNC